jgi:hypothetical protein
LVKSAHFIRSNTGNTVKILPVSVLRVPNTGKPVSVLPVLETLAQTLDAFYDIITVKIFNQVVFFVLTY